LIEIINTCVEEAYEIPHSNLYSDLEMFSTSLGIHVRTIKQNVIGNIYKRTQSSDERVLLETGLLVVSINPWLAKFTNKDHFGLSHFRDGNRAEVNVIPSAVRPIDNNSAPYAFTVLGSEVAVIPKCTVGSCLPNVGSVPPGD
jgi:hypothetical protein